MAKIENISKAFALGVPVVVAVGFAGVLLAQAAQAQQIPQPLQPTAPDNTRNQQLSNQNITIQQAGAGNTPVVNIVKPNSSGLSHNYYTYFNVDTNGLVLNNNSTTQDINSKITQTGIGQNANLAASGSASVILNEVTTMGNGAISYLLGQLETVGQGPGGKAPDVIIANANGITCSGCGFIGTTRVTLTTGTANEEGTTFNVNGGSVVFGSNGANLNGLSYFDIIAGSISAQGQGYIKDNADPAGTNTSQTNVRMLTGAKTYTYDQNNPDNFQYDPQGGTGGGIDLAALGGAYAGKITLISTNSGVGINTPAEMKAAVGDINLTASGKIVFGKAETQTPQGNITATTSADDIEIANQVVSQGNLTLTAAAGAVTVNSGASASSAKGTTVTAGSFTNAGSLTSQEKIEITAQTGDLTNDGLISGQTLNLAAKKTLSNKANRQIIANGGELTLSAAQVTNEGSLNAINGAVKATVTASAGDGDGSFINTGTIGVDPATGLASASSTELKASSFTNSGKVASTGLTGVTTTSGDLTNSGSIAGQSVNADASGLLDNQSGGSINSGTGGASLKAGTFSNSGTVSSDGATSVAATSGDLTNSGSIAGQSVNADASGLLDNRSGGSIVSGTGGTSLKAGTFSNSGTVSSGGATSVTTTSGSLTNYNTISGQTVALKAAGALGNLGASATITSNGGLTADVSGDLTNTGTISAKGDATLKVDGTLTNGTTPTPINATIHADGTLNIAAGALKNYGGVDVLMPRGEISGMILNIVTGGDVENSGNLFATQDLFINSQGNVTNSLGWIKAGNYLSITAAGNFDNIVGILQANSASFSAQTMQNAVLVRPDDELHPRKLPNLIRAHTTESVAQAVAGWDKAVLERFGTADTKVLDTIRLQLGDPFLMQQQQKPGKGASGFPQPAQAAKSKHTDAAKVARPKVF